MPEAVGFYAPGGATGRPAEMLTSLRSRRADLLKCWTADLPTFGPGTDAGPMVRE